jgi:hypothetical protein
MDITTTLQRNLKKLSRMKDAAIKGLIKTLRTIEAEKKKRTADLEEAASAIHRELQQWGWKGNASQAKPKGKTPTATAPRKRIRRNPEQLKGDATKVVAFIRSAGKEGIGGGQIRKKFPGVGQNIKGFVQQHAGEKLKTTGQKVNMRYHAG